MAIALSLISIYVALDILDESYQMQILEAYQRGYDDGAVEAIYRVFDQTQNCQMSKIDINNVSKSLIDISCLTNQLGNNQNP